MLVFCWVDIPGVVVVVVFATLVNLLQLLANNSFFTQADAKSKDLSIVRK